MPTPSPIFVVGAGGHARVVIALARACGLDPVACVETDDTGSRSIERTIDGVAVTRGLEALPAGGCAVVAIGDNPARERVSDLVRKRGATLATLVHPEAWIDPSVTLGAGVQVCARVSVGVGVRVGPGAIVNTGAIVDHECEIGAFAHVAPGARLAGRVTVGDRAMVGLGAVVVQTRRIGTDAVVGAGAVVLADVAPGTRVVGVPGRVLVDGVSNR